SDKTGTLTENRMAVTVLDVAGHRLDVTPDTDRNAVAAAGQRLPAVELLVAGGALCNDAVLEIGEDGRHRAVGDPTEGALVVAASRFGFGKPELEQALPRVAEVPFSSERKRMTTLHRVAGGEAAEMLKNAGFAAPFLAVTKGAVDVILADAAHVLEASSLISMSGELRDRIEAANNRLAQSGMRVLGLAVRPLTELPSTVDEAAVERGMVFVGMVAMVDPARAEVKEAVATCRAAGIRPMMITGDHPLTARYIASELDIGGEAPVVTGVELSQMDDGRLAAAVGGTSVYARVAPEHKLAIVGALQKQGHVVAMTGDGVNDAPALRRADIGVAMGITGTDVSKEAADMVLLDDNFATIVSAVEEGRVIYDNIRKFLKYTLTSNAGEIWVMLLAPFLGMPMALLPVQILWVNLVTDGLPGLALTVEPAERNTMRRKPYHPSENIFGRGLAIDVVWVGLMMGITSLAVGFASWLVNHQGHWQTMIFTTLTIGQMGNALATRSECDSLFSRGRKTNYFLYGTVVLTLGLQLVVTYVPFFQRVFYTAGLTPLELAISLAASTLVFWSIELVKLSRRSRARYRAQAA
ncbi:cation-transporting P-type ATPase, partial [candidate division WOR-3 bacterium]|nr:cation-transporting P-type ATPase [candidate division WOR-3 bacterium]